MLNVNPAPAVISQKTPKHKIHKSRKVWDLEFEAHTIRNYLKHFVELF